MVKIYPKPQCRTRMTRRDKKVVSQIAEYATSSIWDNPTVICVGSNAGEQRAEERVKSK